MTSDALLAPTPHGPSGQRVALVLRDLGGGGIQRSMLRLAKALIARGFAIDFVVSRAKDELQGEVPPSARIVELDKVRLWRGRARGFAADPTAWRLLLQRKSRMGALNWLLRRLPSMVAYFDDARPNAVLTAEPQFNWIAVWGRSLSDSSSRVVICEHNQVTRRLIMSGLWDDQRLHPLLQRAYLKADAIVAVSDGVADDLATHAGIPRQRIATVYNPVVGPELLSKAREPLNHPWFAAGEPPVILTVGRLHPQKDFPTLIRAFARLRARRPARLVILGAANPTMPAYAEEVKALPKALGVADDVALPGFVANPFAFMARASVFALSSAHEGLPTVLIEALACGCPVVSTDCPSGPRDILDHGRFGPLVPVGDDALLAQAIEDVLDAPPPPARLQARAELFSVEHSVNRYLDLLFPGASTPAPDSLLKAPSIPYSTPRPSPDDRGSPEPEHSTTVDVAYGLLVAPTRNVGDDIQSLAQRQFLPRVDCLVNREQLHQPDERLPRDRRIRIVMNGWFLHNVSHWPPHELFEPVFISFHAKHPDLVSLQYRDYYKNYEPIGCRDEYTRDLLHSIGVDAYVSYCLTLTLQNRYPQRNGQIYVVDAHVRRPNTYPPSAPELLDLIPRDVLNHAEYLEHELPQEFDPSKYLQKLERAEELIRKYSTAKLVITTRLHCALPCLALGTPVILLHRRLHIDQRFTGYHDYLYGCASKSDILGFDFDNPKPKNDIGPIRERLIKYLAWHGYNLPVES